MPYPYKFSLSEVRALKPCAPARDRITPILPSRGKIDAAKARELGCTYDDIIWIVSNVAMTDAGLAKRLTGFLNDNAKRVLPIFEERVPGDNRVRDCIQATDSWLAGQISDVEWETAARAAWAAWGAWDAWAAWDAWDAGAAWAAWAARAAWDAWAAWGAWDARDARAARAAWDAWQFDRLIYWLCEAEPVGLPMPERTET